MEVARVLWICLVIPLLIAFPPSVGSSCHKGGGVLDKAIEDALVQNEVALYQLKELFSPTYDLKFVDVLHFNICLSMEITAAHKCSGLQGSSASEESNWNNTHCWELQWSGSVIIGLITSDVLFALDNVVATNAYMGITGHGRQNNLSSDILLKISNHSFPSPPPEEDMEQALVRITSWIKVYAKYMEKPSEWRKEDKGYVSKSYSYWVAETYDSGSHNYPHDLRTLLLYAFIFLNVSICLTCVKYSPRLYQKICNRVTKNTFHMSLYWAASLVLGFANIVYITGSVKHYCKNWPHVSGCILPLGNPCPLPNGTSLYRDEAALFLTRVILIPFLVTVELIAAAFTSRNTILPIPKCIKKTVHYCCCCCCCDVVILRSIQTITLWNFNVFLQILGVIAIPNGILLLVGPAYITAFGSIFILLTVTLVLTVAVVLHWMGKGFTNAHIQNRHRFFKSCGRSFIQMIEVVIGLGLLTTVIGMYYSFLIYKGLQPNGLEGILLSLLPSIVLSTAGWYIKRKFKLRFSNYKETKSTANENTSAVQEDSTEDTENEQLLYIV